MRNELYHHGVKGMKWGHRKQVDYNAKARHARNTALGLGLASGVLGAANKAYNETLLDGHHSMTPKKALIGLGLSAASIGAAAGSAKAVESQVKNMNRAQGRNNLTRGQKKVLKASKAIYIGAAALYNLPMIAVDAIGVGTKTDMGKATYSNYKGTPIDTTWREIPLD